MYPREPEATMSGERRGRPDQHLPKLRLDELLDELQARIDAARGAQDRVHSLLEAVLSVGRELDLAQVLRRIVEAAVVLVDAEYGALGVIGDDRMLSEFHTVGVSDEQRALIGDLPSGHGILGELIRHPEPLRLAEISAHASSYGFPSHHPPMHSFLGVPIRVRDQVFGNLYLTEKRGAAEFDSEDESVLSTLAVAAGVAVENARLYEETRLRERWLGASSEVTRALLSGAPSTDVLGLIVEQARQIADADAGMIAERVPEENALRPMLAVGLDADRRSGLVMSGEDGFVAAVLTTAEPAVSVDVQEDARTSGTRRSGLGSGPWSVCRWRPAARRVVCYCWGERRGVRRSRMPTPVPCSGSPGRRRWRWSWPSGGGTPSRSRCCVTVTGSRVICMTWPFNGCSRRG
ncbi:hypothetical protein GCM10010303_10420 [Streptomyces purpurascens]|nr:hypothetical protein GCM10010303_10420 [Streptomyces purpurascens]